MLLTIPKPLNPAQLAKIHETLAGAAFVDGKLSAGFAAARVKRNEELRPEPARMQRLIRILMASLGHHPIFRFGVLPHRVADPIFARYQPGMAYGDHVDDPIMGSDGPRFRSDVAMTVFLNQPEQYDGGELVIIRTTFGEQRIKLPAGDAVVYPSSSLHRVAEVNRANAWWHSPGFKVTCGIRPSANYSTNSTRRANPCSKMRPIKQPPVMWIVPTPICYGCGGTFRARPSNPSPAAWEMRAGRLEDSRTRIDSPR